MKYIYILILILSGTDFLVAYYIQCHKTENKPLTCPLHGNCEAVVHSKFGKTFGIENAILGMAFNAAIFFGILINYIYNIKILGFFFEFWLMLFAICGALFSLYLMGIMVIKIKEKCTWCIISATIVSIMAIALIFNYILIK